MALTFRQPFGGDWPITQSYGEYIDGVTVGKFHTGIDYGCPVGTEILSSANGMVMAAGWDETGYGLRVIVRHRSDRATLYAHLKRICVNTGDVLTQGQPIGLSGDSGNVTGPHLHFEARFFWNDYKSHFDPFDLPLVSMEDFGMKPKEKEQSCLITADQLHENVQIVAPAGAWGWSLDFNRRATVFPLGTDLHYTGRTTERNGYTYCEVYPEPVKYWVAVHDNTVQILDNTQE